MLTPPSDREQPKNQTSRDLFNDLVSLVMIFVLAAIVIIAILSLLGPAIGNVFSNIVMGI